MSLTVFLNCFKFLKKIDVIDPIIPVLETHCKCSQIQQSLVNNDIHHGIAYTGKHLQLPKIRRLITYSTQYINEK